MVPPPSPFADAEGTRGSDTASDAAQTPHSTADGRRGPQDHAPQQPESGAPQAPEPQSYGPGDGAPGPANGAAPQAPQHEMGSTAQSPHGPNGTGTAAQDQDSWSTTTGTDTAATGFDSYTGSRGTSSAPQDPTMLGQVPPNTGGQAPYGDSQVASGGPAYNPSTGGQAPVGDSPVQSGSAWSSQGTSGAPQDPTVRGPVPPSTGGQAPVGEPPADPRYAAPPQGGQWQSPPQEQQWGGGQPYPPQQQPHPQQYQQQPPGMPPSLDDVPVRRAKKAPGSGWRRAVHHMSGGAINPGMSAEELRLQELVARIRQPVRGDYRIAVLSLKGGVGKTTTTMGIGSIFASIRGDRVIAVDANPDFGTLSQRVPLQTRSTVRDLLLDRSINSYGDVRRHTSQATSRLEVLGSERDPAASESFNEDEYRQVARVLQRYYNIILTDCGTGLMHSAMAGVLDLAHSLVLISSSAIDGARSAAATLDWLSLHGHDHLVRNAVVVINLPRPGSPNVGIQQLREYFLSRCRAVHIIPYDPHLSEGAEIDLAQLHKNTKRSLVELAATVADDFATDHRRFQRY
nr:AAA family ATPase [Nocardia mexicana]